MWKNCFDEFLEQVYDSLETHNINWMIMGSSATALQGCQVTPNDIDIIFEKPVGVLHLAQLMMDYTVDQTDEVAAHFNNNWQSSKQVPVIIDEDNSKEDCWHFARWFINDFKIEAAHIKPPLDYLSNKKENSGIWEGGPEIWLYVKRVKYGRYSIPVIPLEIQLQTNLQRGLTSRIDEIIRVFKEQGYNHSILQKSLSKGSMEIFNKLFLL